MISLMLHLRKVFDRPGTVFLFDLPQGERQYWKEKFPSVLF